MSIIINSYKCALYYAWLSEGLLSHFVFVKIDNAVSMAGIHYFTRQNPASFALHTAMTK
jgi:hypothetical protein